MIVVRVLVLCSIYEAYDQYVLGPEGLRQKWLEKSLVNIINVFNGYCYPIARKCQAIKTNSNFKSLPKKL